jgi:hypothetical protein
MTEKPSQMPPTQSNTERKTFRNAPIQLPCSMSMKVWRLKEEKVV